MRQKFTRGQSSLEYLLVCGALIAALLVPINPDTDGRNVMEICRDALKTWYTAFAHAKSQPPLPF
ncbi:hypothetical protein [Shewanella zhangzhouensis]|uniref:hypothetical protein n=1 Tax=Shewanella zhangzhouensis TaxID=2864213 RepID=UPI001C65D692|nr:hypothetical protein [Shewanella zhangzhouensis]QYK05995.1 hypothetical protein K0H63_03905 [Shewanella zhangzhouensis]